MKTLTPLHRTFLILSLFLSSGSTTQLFAWGSNAPVVAATPTPTPKPKPTPKIIDTRPARFKAGTQSVFGIYSPHAPAQQQQFRALDRMAVRLREIDESAGVGGPVGKDSKEVAPPVPPLLGNFSAHGSYSYQSEDDERKDGVNTITNSGSGGFDMTIGKTFVGLLYSYSHMSGSSDQLNLHSSSDANFISLLVAHPLNNIVKVGLMGGYGHIDSRIWLRNPSSQLTSNSDSWSIGPSINLNYRWDRLYASLATAYTYLHTDTDESGFLNVAATIGYNFTDWLTGEIGGRFSQTLHDTSSGEPEDDNWFGTGVAFKERLTSKLTIFQSYNFDVNRDYHDHSFSAGLTYSF